MSYLPEVVADEQFQKFLLKLLQGGVHGEEEVIQMPCGGLLEARLPQSIAWSGKRALLTSFPPVSGCSDSIPEPPQG